MKPDFLDLCCTALLTDIHPPTLLASAEVTEEEGKEAVQGAI